jgi:hypothetical protein
MLPGVEGGGAGLIDFRFGHLNGCLRCGDQRLDTFQIETTIARRPE